MIITNVYGGLGNQMFQYAFGKSLAYKQNKQLLIDNSIFDQYELRKFLLDKFNLSYAIATKDEIKQYELSNKFKRYFLRHINSYIPFKSNYFFEKKEFCFDKEVFNSSSKYFAGYWQSFKYFSQIRELLLKEFTLVEPIDQQNLILQNKIINNSSVSLHIRRGDYIILSKNKSGQALCPISYYEKAIKYIGQNVENPYFFIFSDDIQWVKENLPIQYNAEFIDINSKAPEKDLILMKNCKDNIIANSSFSWWGAWLNENPKKIVIAPKMWMNDMESSDDLIESDWIIM